jgi:hypothetical protein
MRPHLFFIAFSVFSSGFCIAQNKIFLDIKVNGKWGFIDTTGKIVIEPKYEWAFAWNNETGVQVIKLSGKYYLLDTLGNFINKEPFDEVGDFSRPYLKVSEPKINVQKNGKWGFVDTKGNEVIPFVFDAASSFRDGIAKVEKNNETGYIDSTGKFYLLDDYDRINILSAGLIEIEKYNLSGLYSTVDQKKLFEPRYQKMKYLGNDRLLVYDPVASKYVFLNKKGERVFMPDKYYYFITSSEADSIYIFSTLKAKNKYGIMNAKGDILVKPKLSFDMLYEFRKCGDELLAVFSIKNKDNISMWGAINTKGEIVIPAKYNRLSIRTEGGFYVTINGKKGIMDRSEKIILPVIYNSVENYIGGIIKVSITKNQTDKKGYISLGSGKVIWQPSD